MASKIYRPRITKSGGKWRRAKHSRLFSGPVMLNPRRRRRRSRKGLFTSRHNPMVTVRYPSRSRRRHTRRNPALNLKGAIRRMTNRKWLLNLATISGGLLAGMASKSFVVSIMPKIGLGSQTQFSGVGSIALGSLMIGFGKKRVMKEIGVVIAATGLYDLLAQNIPIGLPALPSFDVMSSIPGLAAPVSASYPVPTLPVSPVAALSASFPAPARAGYQGSYMAPDMRTEGFHGDPDSPYADIW